QLAQLTDSAHFGDCSYPVADDASSANHISFICTGDPLENGTTGNRAFTFERSTLTLMQINGKGDVQPPLAANLGVWFLTLSTTTTIGGTTSTTIVGTTTTTGAPTTTTIGATTTTTTLPPSANGSQISITTRDGTTTVPLQARPTDAFRLVIGAPDQTMHQASI